MKEKLVSLQEVRSKALNKQPIPDQNAPGFVLYFLEPAGVPHQKDQYEAAVDAYDSDFNGIPAVAVCYYLRQNDSSFGH